MKKYCLITSIACSPAAGPQPPSEATPLLEMLTNLAVNLEVASGGKQQPHHRQLLAGLATRVCRALERLGLGVLAGRLASHYR